jgi:uncharacterized protein (TIGR03118 family)
MRLTARRTLGSSFARGFATLVLGGASHTRCRGIAALLAVIGLLLLPAAWIPLWAQAGLFHQTNLVSDQPGVAVIHDPSLVGAWGVSLSPTGGAFWVSADSTGVSNLYSGDVSGSPFSKAALTVTIPGGGPTGQVFNPTADFIVSSGADSGRAIFIFATETGGIMGWNPAVPGPSPSTIAQPAASTPGAVYTGLAIGTSGSGNFLYAVDYQNGKIDVFNGTFQPTTLAGSFTDLDIPDSYRPFNIQNLGGELYVTYGKRARSGECVPSGGTGFVSVFDTNGNFLRRLISGDRLKAPWGLTIAPAGWGPFGGALLVGNFGDGRIGAYDPATGAFLGQLRGVTDDPIEIVGLLGLSFGNGVSAGDRNALYFAAAPDGMTHGLFGSLRVTLPVELGR